MMRQMTRKITKEQYERALQHSRYIAPEDRADIFTEAEM